MSILVIILLLVLIGAGLIAGTLAYINHVYSNASTGITKIANRLDFDQISLSFMIP